MKYVFLIAATLVGMAAWSQSSIAGECASCAGGAGYGPRVESASNSERYGVLPGLRWGWWKKSDSCGDCGVAHVRGKCHTCNVPEPAPQQLQGTLVFPVNPFVRSPRDFFMWEPK